MTGWLVISHLGAAMLGCVVGVLAMKLLAASEAASREDHDARSADGAPVDL